MRKSTSRTSGFTLVEIIISIFVIGLIMAAIGGLMTRIFSLDRRELEQLRITEEARLQLQRVTDTVRKAQHQDCNQDSDTADDGDHWLRIADDYEIIFFSDIDEDSVIEEVHYYIPNGTTQLWRGVTNPNPSPNCNYPNGQEVTTQIANSIQNRNLNQPLFQYFDTGYETDTPIAPPLNQTERATVDRVRLNLLVDVSETQAPQDADLVTDVVPRTKPVSTPAPAPTAAPTATSAVTVTPTPGPVSVDLQIAEDGPNPIFSDGPLTVDHGDDISLRWTTSGTTNCLASVVHQCHAMSGVVDSEPTDQVGDEVCSAPNWNGSKDATGGEISITNTTASKATYTLECTDSVGNASTDSVVSYLVPRVWMRWEGTTDPSLCRIHNILAVSGGLDNAPGKLDIDHATHCEIEAGGDWYPPGWTSGTLTEFNGINATNFTAEVRGSEVYSLSCLNENGDGNGYTINSTINVQGGLGGCR